MRSKIIRLCAGFLCVCGGVSAEITNICAPAVNFSYVNEQWEKHPVFSHDLDQVQSAGNPRIVSDLLAMPDERILALLPKTSGVFFVGCPNCTSQGQGGDFIWASDEPEKIVCKYCQQAYPCDKYRENGVQTVIAPGGKQIGFPYYERPDGRRYYFEAGIEYRKARYFENAAYLLALHHLKTGSEESARKSALIICGLAQAFPDFVYKYDFPNVNTEFCNGIVPPEKLKGGWRTSRWTRWAYGDIPQQVVLAYDAIFNSAALKNYAAEKHIDLQKTVEEGFFRAATEGAFANREMLDNMSPLFWQEAIIAGRVARCPDYVHLAMARFQKYLQQRFFFDGFWMEATVSYFAQSSAEAFDRIFSVIRNYSDPPGYVSPCGLPPFRNCNPERDFASGAGLVLARLKQSHYPDGFVLPMADSWMLKPDPAITRNELPFEQKSYLQAGVGHACLAARPDGNQAQMHLFWPPKGGHFHNDTLSLTLFAKGQERLSDLGYTHTRYKSWNICSASHNLVTVDYNNQPFDERHKGRGNLVCFDGEDSACQMVETDGAYANNGRPYRRTLFMIDNGAGGFYAADFFLAGGGRVYDYFLHGNAAAGCEDKIELAEAGGRPLPLVPCKPAPEELLAGWREPANEAEQPELKKGYSYGFLTDTAGAALPAAGARLCFAGKDGVNTFVHIPPQGPGGAKIFTGRNCTARVKTDNSQVYDNYRRFMMLRQEDVETARFATVIETCRGEANVKKAERPADNILRVTLAGREDIIFLNQPEEKTVSCGGQELAVKGQWGWVSVKDGKVDNYRLIAASLKTPQIAVSAGPAGRLKVVAVENDNTLVFAPGEKPDFPPGGFLLVTHGSELSHGYFVKSAEASARKVTVADVLGFELSPDGNSMTQTCYPQAKVRGETSALYYPVCASGHGQ